MDERLRTFLQVVESESLSAAATLLHVTQPTVTRHLQLLERDFGARLFDRVGRRLLLNRAGERALQYARQSAASEQRLRDDLAAFADPQVGTVQVGAGLTPSIYLLPPVFAAYRRQYPRVQFQVRTGSSRVISSAVLAREVDLGIVTTVAENERGLDCTALVEDELLLVASRDHALASGQPVSFAAVAQCAFVLMPASSGLRRIAQALAARFDLHLQVAMETDSLESLNQLVQHGLGLSLLPRSAVQADLDSGRLALVNVADDPLPKRTVTLVTRSDGSLSAGAAQFAAALPRLCKTGKEQAR